MTVANINDPRVQKLIEDANRGMDDLPDMPDVAEPMGTVFSLAAGCIQDDGNWATEFEVRELTGRDEEALARITDVGRSLVALTERGLVRLGKDPASPQRLDGVVGGDWDTILLAIRAVTFGPTLELKPTCRGCKAQYNVTIDITKDLAVRTANREDLTWTVKGRTHTYDVYLYTGATQRRIFEMMAEGATIAAINTEILMDSINHIDGMPVMGRETIRDLGIFDRKELLRSIQERRVGPDLQGVKIKCPTCGHEQSNPLNAAALFQWD